MTVTTGGRGSSRLSSTGSSSSSSSSSSTTPTMSTCWPSSAPTSSMASSDNDWVMETISPAVNRIFTISAAPTPSLSPSSWGVAPRWTLTPGVVGAAGSTGAGAVGGAGGATTAVATSASTWPLPAGGVWILFALGGVRGRGVAGGG